MPRPARLPIKAQDKRIWFSRNPEDKADCQWFSTEKDAFRSWQDWGDQYLYTEINEGEGTSLLLNETFAEWNGGAVAA